MRGVSLPAALGLLCVAVLSGCLGGSTKPVDIGPATSSGSTVGSLHVDFEFAPIGPLIGQAVQFTDLSQDESFELIEHAWDFGDHTASTDANPAHAYAESGVYKVVLRVRNAAGTQANASHLVSVLRATGSPLPSPTTTPVPTPAGLMVFGKPVTVRSSGGGEPALGVDSKGHYFVEAIGALYRSDDGGKSFARIAYPLNAPGDTTAVELTSGDSHVVVDGSDHLWVSDLGGATPPLVGSTTAWRSTDYGATWQGSPAASDTVGNDRNWIAPFKDGTAYLTYRQVGLNNVHMTKTTDGGLTWIPLTRAFQWTSYPFVDPRDGTVYVVESDANKITVAVSKDGGSSFDEKTAASRKTSTDKLFVNGAVDQAGNVYVAWSDKDTGQYDVYMAYSTTKGASWKGPFLVSGGLGTHIFPWIAAGGDGKVVVAWYGTAVKGNPDELGASTEWFVEAAQSLGAHADRPVFSQVRASPGSIHKGEICTSGTSCDLPTGGKDRDLLDFFMVQVGPDGKTAIAYADDGSSSTTALRFILQSGGPLAR